MANCGSQQMPLYLRTVNYGLASLLNQSLAQPSGYRPWPGFRHPCQKDGFSGLAGLVYNARSKRRGGKASLRSQMHNPRPLERPVGQLDDATTPKTQGFSSSPLLSSATQRNAPDLGSCAIFEYLGFKSMHHTPEFGTSITTINKL